MLLDKLKVFLVALMGVNAVNNSDQLPYYSRTHWRLFVKGQFIIF